MPKRSGLLPEKGTEPEIPPKALGCNTSDVADAEGARQKEKIANKAKNLVLVSITSDSPSDENSTLIRPKHKIHPGRGLSPLSGHLRRMLAHYADKAMKKCGFIQIFLIIRCSVAIQVSTAIGGNRD